MGRLKDKVAVITGAGTGIGRSCYELFASEGATVIGVGRSVETLNKAAAAVRSAGGSGHVIAGDVSEEATADRVFDTVVNDHGRADILVHAAGVGWSWADKSPGSMDPVATTPFDKWEELIRINLSGCFLMNRAAVRAMVKQGGGSIVNVASILGLKATVVGHTYSATKAGVLNLTRGIAVTYGAAGVRANCLAPGYTDTPMISSVMNWFEDPAVAARLAPMARAGTPMEMAKGCLYLASDDATYTTGSVLVVDGGTNACFPAAY